MSLIFCINFDSLKSFVTFTLVGVLLIQSTSKLHMNVTSILKFYLNILVGWVQDRFYAADHRLDFSCIRQEVALMVLQRFQNHNKKYVSTLRIDSVAPPLPI